MHIVDKGEVHRSYSECIATCVVLDVSGAVWRVVGGGGAQAALRGAVKSPAHDHFLASYAAGLKVRLGLGLGFRGGAWEGGGVCLLTSALCRTGQQGRCHCVLSAQWPYAT